MRGISSLRKFALGALGCALFSHQTLAATSELAFSRNARTFETTQSSLLAKGMAHACLTSLLPDSLPCNPALTALIKKPRLSATGLLSNGYPTLERMKKLLGGDIQQETIDALFSSERVLQVEANAELAFSAKNLSAKYTPLAVRYFSVIRNETNPDVELYAVEEKNFTAQTGFEVLRRVYAGLQIRHVERKFIKKRFKLFDLATPAGKDLLKSQTETITYVEPGVFTALPSEWLGDWRWRGSLMLVNGGFAQEDHPDIEAAMELQGAIGFSPPMPWGKLDIEIAYRGLTAEEEASEKFRFGGMYQFGAMSVVGGVDSEGVSGGVFHGMDQLNAGIVYSTTQVPWRSLDYYAQTVYVQLGWQL